jgi:hypothetical protein
MFKIATIYSDLKNRPAVKFLSVNLYRPSLDTWVWKVESTTNNLILEPTTDGCFFYDPYGDSGKIEFKAYTANTEDQLALEKARTWSNQETHDPNQPTKYYLSKIVLPEKGWSQALEDSLFHRCHEFIFREEWLHTTPVGTL